MKQPTAWAYEVTEYADRTYEAGWKKCVSFEKPFDSRPEGESSIRNVVPLYAATE